MPCQVRWLIGSIGQTGADLFDGKRAGLLALVLDEDLHWRLVLGTCVKIGHGIPIRRAKKFTGGVFSSVPECDW